MASVTKRGKTWQYSVSRYVKGKYDPIRKGGFRTQKEAKAEAADIESKLSKGIKIKTKKVIFSEYFEEWVEVYKFGLGKNSRARYENSVKNVREEFGERYIQDITKRDYQKFLNNYGEDRAKATVKKFNSHVRACVKDAIDDGIIHIDFTRNVRLTGLDGKKSEEMFLNLKETYTLFKKIIENLHKTPSYYLLLLGLTSGMRYAEMVGLTRADFDFENNIININKTWGYTKRMHEGWGPTKNRETRKITMDQETMSIFKQWFAETPDNIKKLVFYSPHSKYHVLTNSTVNSVLKRACEKLKLLEISVHCLRHTHASCLLYQDVSIDYVSKRLGHRNITTTTDTYIHMIKEIEEKSEIRTNNIFENMHAS